MIDRDSERLGRVVGSRYRLERLLGVGGMGSVYLATHVQVGKSFALKMLHNEGAEGSSARERFLREARVAATVKHPGIVDVFDVGETEDGEPYMVMELLHGESLADRLRNGKLAPHRAMKIAREVLAALGAAHAKGIVHRDIKPQNIFLEERGGEDVARVLDFGIAKDLGAEASALTHTGAAVGTALYMSPEQATARKDIDARADIWAVGVVLYEMLVGEPPFLAPTLSAVIAKIVTEDPPGMVAKNHDIARALEEIVFGALVRDPAKRTKSAESFAKSLEEFERREATTDPSLARTEAAPLPFETTNDALKRAEHRRFRFVFFAVGLAALVGGGVFFFARRTETPKLGGEAVVTSAQSTAPDKIPAEPAPKTDLDAGAALPTPSASSPSQPVADQRLAPATKGRTLTCPTNEFPSEGHCCARGLKWSKMQSRCERPLATNLP